MSGLAHPSLRKQNLGEIARALGKPWLTYRIARFGELEVDLYICQGIIAMHRHPDQDELFLVYEGEMRLGSERGDVGLRAEELVVVPKGVAHQSSSSQPATVVLLRVADDLALRRDGRWRLFATDADPPLEKLNLGALYMGLSMPYQPVMVVSYEGWRVWLVRCAGAGPPIDASPNVTPLLVLRGAVTVQTAGGEAMPARQGDVVLVPPGTAYHFETDTAAMVLSLMPAR